MAVSSSDPDDIRAPELRRDDFLGAFAVIESEAGILMVQNERVIGGQPTLTWDLPGGQVEPGEALTEALARELEEEVDIVVRGEPTFLFYQEGERVRAGVRHYMWRSFFFAVRSYDGTPAATSEVRACRWWPRDELPDQLHAPYHQSFVDWLREGGTAYRAAWQD
jgi:ADP-ribose pyrophosphatase YjhB (NUDIX family)